MGLYEVLVLLATFAGLYIAYRKYLAQRNCTCRNKRHSNKKRRPRPRIRRKHLKK